MPMRSIRVRSGAAARRRIGAAAAAGLVAGLVTVATVAVGTEPVSAWPTAAVRVAGADLTYGSNADQLNGALGAAVDSAGNLYVADSYNHRVQKWAPGALAGVTVAGGNGAGSAANQLLYPAAVALDTAGNLYVADTNNNRIQKFPAGSTSTTTGITVAGGNRPGSAANQLTYPTAVALDTAGNLYVADTINNRIQKFPAGSTSTTNGVTVAGGNGPGSAANQLRNPRSIALDPAGNLFVLDGYNYRVQRFPAGSTSTTNGVTVAGGNGAGSAANQFDLSFAVSRDSNGNLYVVDSYNHRVLKFPAGSTSSTNAVTVAGGNGAGSAMNQLDRPWGLAVDGAGRLYVSDTENDRVLKFKAGSTSRTNGLLVAGSNAQTGPATLYSPSGVAIGPGGAVYVADTKNHRVQRWAPGATSGVTVAGLGGPGTDLDQLNGPWGIVVDPVGNVYVADRGNHRVMMWEPGAVEGIVVAGGNGYGSTANKLAGPAGIARDSAGNLYVADTYNQRVQKFPAGSTSATNGTTVAGGNGLGSAANQLRYPTGVIVDTSGNLYVADTENERVQKFPAGSTSATNGTTVAGGNGQGSAANQFDNPGGLAIDPVGNLYVADELNNRVQKFAVGSTSSTNGFNVTTYTGYGLDALLRYPLGLAFDSSGNLYVADSGYDRVMKWAGTPNAPTGITGVPTNTGAAVAFTPGDPGATAVSLYTATCSSGSGGVTRTGTGTSSPIAVSGLTQATTYSCTVTATNAAGESPSSLRSANFVTLAAPGAPGTPAVIRNDFGSVLLTTTAPASNGGSAVSTYTFTSSPGALTCTAFAPALSCSITGLTGGVSYTFTARATNGVGSSAPSSASAGVVAFGRTQFANTSNVTNSSVASVTPNAVAATPVGARLMVYVAARSTSLAGPTISSVTFPNGGAATCNTTYTTIVGGSATPATGIRGLLVICNVTTAIPAAATVQVNLSSASARVITMGESIVGPASVSLINSATGTATAPSVGSGLGIPTAGSVVVGIVGFQDGALALATDTDSTGGAPWSAAMRLGSGLGTVNGLSLLRQYKFPASTIAQTYNSATVTPATCNWIGTLVALT